LIAGISARRPPWRSAARAKRRTEKQVPDDGISAAVFWFSGTSRRSIFGLSARHPRAYAEGGSDAHPALVILTIATVLTAAPARAQTYHPAYPVCLHVYGPAIYWDAQATSKKCQLAIRLPQHVNAAFCRTFS
jgi:hypothetical protein